MGLFVRVAQSRNLERWMKTTQEKFEVMEDTGGMLVLNLNPNSNTMGQNIAADRMLKDLTRRFGAEHLHYYPEK